LDFEGEESKLISNEQETLLGNPFLSAAEDDPYTAQQRFQIQVLENMLYRDHEYSTVQMRPVNFSGTSTFMEAQRNITKNMREILLDWMMEVCEEFMIKRDTMYISISFIDRYISMAEYDIPKNELQLIGVTSLYLACKVEEVYIPRI
jgi:cyclin E